MIFVVGSVALNELMGYNYRAPSDLDIVGTYNDVSKFVKARGCKAFYPLNDHKWIGITRDDRIIEAEIAWEGSSAEAFLDIVKRGSHYPKEDYHIPSMNSLLAMKLSHRYLRNSPHFEKTRNDIMVMRSKGAVIDSEWNYWIEKREEETYNYEHPKLNVNKSEFFSDDGIKYVYDHDSIHRAVALGDRPAYLEFKPEDQEVFCDRNMFEACSEEVKLNAVYEEAIVLALERSQIPFEDVNPRESFIIALKKICTSITSGWFREYAWEHYDEVVNMYDKNYVTKFWRKAANGEVLKV